MVPRAKEYEVASVGVVPLVTAGGKTVVRSEVQGRDYVLSDREAEMLFSCGAFKKTSQHATALSEAGVRKKQVREVVDKFRRYRLLITHDEFRDLLENDRERCAASPGMHPITHLGIPTKNRTESLIRCFSSFVGNAQAYGRSIKVCVVDDSRSHQQVVDNRTAVLTLGAKYNVPVVHVSRGDRKRLAKRIADNSGVPAEVAAFALLGNEGIENTFGASRNTLLLLTAGYMTLQVDDDTACFIRTRRRASDDLLFTSQVPLEFWHFDSSELIKEDFSDGKADFFTHNERLLGRSIPSLLNLNRSRSIHVEAIKPSMVKSLLNADSRIAVTQAGWYGDAGSINALHRLMHNGDSFDRLTRSRDTYHRAIGTRQTARIASGLAVSGNTGLMGVTMGLDNTNLLPPFFPVGRNEDALFARLLRGCFKSRFIGYLPDYLIGHLPMERRRNLSLSYEPYSGAGIVSVVIDSLIPGYEARPVHAMQAISTGLCAIANTSDREFESYIHQLCAKHLVGRITYLEQLLERRSDAPGYWRSDVGQIILDMKHALLQHRVVFGATDEARRRGDIHTLRSLLFDYARVLEFWPDMYECAKFLALAESW